jgi:hypothetical protein
MTETAAVIKVIFVVPVKEIKSGTVVEGLA